MHLRFLALAFAVCALSACFDFDKAYCTGYCDAGTAGGGAGGGGNDDAGLPDAGHLDAGEVDAGELDAGDVDAGDLDAGESDAGAPDAGTEDAGCGPAVQLIVVAPASFLPDVCSPPVRVQLVDACGGAVAASANVAVALTRSSPTMTLFSDGTCGTSPFSWAIGAGTSELELNVTDSVPGMPTLTASSAGLDAGSEVLTIGCAAGQKVCPGQACVPAAGCCDDSECTAGGLPWVCGATSHLCEPPPCTGFPASCTVYDDRTASGASRTVTFDSNGYSPKCMRVTASQDVTFSGSFALHPLQQTCGPSDRQMTTTFGTSKVVRFPSFGTYGYRCANHPAFEQGAIRVP